MFSLTKAAPKDFFHACVCVCVCVCVYVFTLAVQHSQAEKDLADATGNKEGCRPVCVHSRCQSLYISTDTWGSTCITEQVRLTEPASCDMHYT